MGKLAETLWVAALAVLANALLASSLLAQAVGPTWARPSGELALQAHAAPAADLPALTAQLQAEYAGHKSVRIAADTRTSQLLVYGPPEVQAKIAQHLQSRQAALPSPNDAVAPQRALQEPHAERAEHSAAGEAPRREVRLLQQTTWREFEQNLNRLGGIATAQPAERNGEVAVFGLRSRDATPARLQVDRRTDQVTVEGSAATTAAWLSLVAALDQRPTGDAENLQVVPLERSAPTAVRKMLTAFQNQPDAQTPAATQPLGSPFAPVPRAAVEQLAQNQPVPPRDGAPPADAADESGLIGPVQIEFLEGLDVIVIRGNRRDVERVTEIINEIEQLSVDTQPTIEVYPLQHVDSTALMTLIGQIYEQVPSLRQTRVSLTPLGKPNAVLMIGRPEGVKTIIDLVERLDQPVEAAEQFQTFYLKHSAAATAQTTLQEFFAERPGLGTRVRVTADVRTNALLVHASPRDMTEVALMVRRIDTPVSAAVNELRVFPLQNSLASELAPILQQAILGQEGARQTLPGVPTPAPAAGGAAANQAKTMMLRFMTIDTEGQRQIKSGILSDVKITADPRGNALVISAPAESMDLLGALVRQLDQMPAAEAQIKVFTIVNGDATSLVLMLETLFGAPAGGGGGNQAGLPAGGLQALLQSAASSGESSLVPLRFSVDTRTNSIVASGSVADLGVVEAILLRLDDSDVRQRQSVVYRLKNAPALDVATAINEFLRSERQVQQFVPGLVSPFEQIEREVVVVPEVVSNSLIVSATPRYFEEIRKIVEQLDARPPLVVIQVLLAEVAMNNTDEFGIEVGLQDSVLFDRSVVQTVATGGGAQLVPGFNFNNQPLGNSASPQAQANASTVGGQGLTSFSLNRINNELGFGGLVLSASSESISVLLRALNESRRVEVLARPQVTTLDNQPAYIQVGQRVPRVTATNITQVGQVNSITLENVGLILGVTPRISPDGLVVMEIDAERSEISPEEGVPISIAANGDVLRSPIVNTTTAQTTVSSLSGQTIVLGGLITKTRSQIHRRVPVLSDVPLLGNLFRYDRTTQRRTELLIIMTPRVIRNELDADIVKQVESSRMSWCLADVVKVHGPSGLRSRSDEWTDGEIPTVYPDATPQGIPLEEIPFAADEQPPSGSRAGSPKSEAGADSVPEVRFVNPRTGEEPRGPREAKSVGDSERAVYFDQEARVERSSYQTPAPRHPIHVLPPVESSGAR